MTADTRPSRVVGGRLAAGCSFLFSSSQSSSLFLSVNLSSSDPLSTLRFLILTHVLLYLHRRDNIYQIFNISIIVVFLLITAVILTLIESRNHRIRYIERAERRLIKSFWGR